MADAASLIKRGSPSKWPDEFVVITDPKHPSYDERIETVPVTDERIRNFVAVGQVQPVSAVVVGNNLVLNAGRQRWKRATVINHIVGVRMYGGNVGPIWEAIERIKRTPFAKWISDQVPDGMKLQFSLYRGDEMEAGRASVSENEQRDEDPREAKIRKAQRMAKQGHQPEDIADAFGFGTDKAAIAKVKRWLKVDLSKPSTPKTRGKSTRPSAAKVKAVGALAAEHASDEIRVVLDWVNGTNGVDDAEFYRVFPALKPEAKAKKAA